MQLIGFACRFNLYQQKTSWLWFTNSTYQSQALPDDGLPRSCLKIELNFGPGLRLPAF
jgi:hypothetical protein